jgi:biofilm PGA synthesis N-glycosyltransferase PgaC
VSENLPAYVLITPARNEEEFIGVTIQCMIRQTALPLKWVIVSDGSTDRTDDIVRRYAEDHNWIEFVRMPDRTERSFGGKALSFNAGLERVRDLRYAIVGNLDADMSFDSDLFAFLLKKFRENEKLGVAGVPFTEDRSIYDFRFSSIEHVSGACQLFRRECLEAIGGYTPMKRGGIDVLAVLTARMKRWETRTFPERVCVHHRSMGSARQGAVPAKFALGEKDYLLGRHPIWELFRACYQMTRRPVIVGGMALLAGYLWCLVRRVERSVPTEVVAFQRREQIERLKGLLLVKGRDRRYGSSSTFTASPSARPNISTDHGRVTR